MPIVLDPFVLGTTHAPKVPTDALVVGPHSILSYNGLVLNDRRTLEKYFVSEFSGFEDADLRISEEENPQQDGSVPGPGFYGSRTMTLSGKIDAVHYTTLLNMQEELGGALVDLAEKPLRIEVLSGGYLTHEPVEIYCRKADKVLLSKQLQAQDNMGRIRRPFTVAFKASDPTYRSVAVYEETFAPELVFSLGRSYDRSYDLTYGEALGPDDSPVPHEGGANSVVVTNAGNWYALPVIRFNGYMDGVVLTNTTNGHVMRLTEPVFDGDWLEVDVRAGTVKDSVGTARFDRMDTTSDWLRLVGTAPPYDGTNELVLTVSAYGDNAGVDVSWKNTWMAA